MKRFTIVMSFFLVCETLFSQTSVCPNVGTVFTAPFAQGSYTWRLRNRLTGQEVNGSVATLSVTWASRVSGANSVNITFNSSLAARELLRLEWIRETSSWFSWTVRSRGSFDIDVPLKQPTILFQGSGGICTANFEVPFGYAQQGVTYRWRRSDGTEIGTGRTISVPLPITGLNVAAEGCGQQPLIASTTPPPGLGNSLTLNDDTFGNTCASPSQEFNATATLCNPPASSTWTWASSGQLQIIPGSQVDNTTSSTVRFRYLGVTGAGQGTITLTNSGTVNGQTVNQSGTLNYNVLAFPDCEFFLRKPKEDNTVLPTSVKSASDKITITDEPDLDMKAQNTEGVTEDKKMGANNKASIQKALYPNPAKDFINVENIQNVQSILVMDLSGKVLRTIAVEENEIMRTVNVSNLSDGMYILKKIKQDGQIEASKFQVMH
jgi:hypothetical protein